MRREFILAAGLAAFGLLAGTQANAQQAGAQQEPEPSANAVLFNADGNRIGNVALWQLQKGVRIFAQASNLPAGIHGFHIHETGACEPPDFESAGDHFAPAGKSHGWNSEGGPHAGDLPNVHVSDGGMLAVEHFTDKVSLEEGGENSLFDQDGSAVLIHADADDYESDPSGNAGARLACGVVEKTGAQ